MRNRKAAKTKYYSWKSGELAMGCRLCVKGRKLVLFVTGICSQSCYYCPISEKKKDRDVIYANEWKISSDKDIITEARLCHATGAGITGGDPLCRLDRTVKYIRMLKKEFGTRFHIHMYVPLTLVTKSNLQKLFDAGLDEIRAHLLLDRKNEWGKLRLLKEHKWHVGVEVPVIPGRESELMAMIDFVKGKVDFLNLNEMEISEINLDEFILRSLRCKDGQSYAIRGSDSLGKRLLKYAAKQGLNCHYCTAKLKDRVQMANRIMLRARSVALPTDIITKDGTLLRGAIYLKESVPGFSYSKRKLKNRADLTKKLIGCLPAVRKLLENSSLDLPRLRILADAEKIIRSADDIKKQGLVAAVVEEYPTQDALIVDFQLL